MTCAFAAASARLAGLVVLISLTACTTIPVDEATSRSIEERQAELIQFDRWQVAGRIALSSPDQSITAGIDWAQLQQDYKVSLTSPLGQALFVEQTGSVARLQSKGQAPVLGRHAESLIEQQLRVRVPMTQLSFWLRGLPGNEGSPAYDKFGRLRQLRYTDADGIDWRAEIRRYQQFEELDLPGLIVVEGGGYNIRLAVTEWASASPTASPGKKSEQGGVQEQNQGGKRINIPGLN